MSYNIFFCSDHHLGHEALYSKFTNEDGTFARPFGSADAADEIMIERHNSVVRPNDRVYFLGDVAFHKRHLVKLHRMVGRKVLIKGNHDNLDLKDYVEVFDDVRAVHQFKGLVMTHIPIHTQSLGRWGFNVHGHLHSHRVMELDAKGNPTGIVDSRYLNVSMEQINYTPISLEEVKKLSPNKDLN